MGHGLEKTRFVVQADGVLVVLPRPDGAVVHGPVPGERGLGRAQGVGQPIQPSPPGALRGFPFGFTPILLFAQDLRKDVLIPKNPMPFLDLVHRDLIYRPHGCGRADDRARVQIPWPIAERVRVLVRLGSVDILRQGGVGHRRTSQILRRIGPTYFVRTEHDLLLVFGHHLSAFQRSGPLLDHHTVPASQALIRFADQRVISLNHELWRQLKPHVVPIDDQDQVIVLDFLSVRQKLVYPPDLPGVSAVTPITLGIKSLPVVDECRGRVTEDKGG